MSSFVNIELVNVTNRQPTVTVHSIGNRHILKDEEYKYLKDNLGKQLPLHGLYFNDTHIVIDRPETEEVVCLFQRNNFNATIWLSNKLGEEPQND